MDGALLAPPQNLERSPVKLQTDKSLTAMNDPQVQYVSDDQGEVTGVILSIQLWRDILSELETQHLLKSETMRQRLLVARQRSSGIAFDSAITELGLG